MIDLKDLRIFGWSSKPKGAWSLGIDTGVHIIHLPTGIEIKEDFYRSQHQNKELAMAKLQRIINE